MNKYDSIIDIKHFEFKNHERMSMHDRSAQFAPFAALTGFEGKIDDANILNDTIKFLDESELEIINNKLQIINNNYKNDVYITYLEKKNNHFKYVNKKGIVKKVDFINNYLLFVDKTKIILDSIINIDLEKK